MRPAIPRIDWEFRQTRDTLALEIFPCRLPRYSVVPALNFDVAGVGASVAVACKVRDLTEPDTAEHNHVGSLATIV